MHCSECGEQIGSARFCPNCGAPAGKQVIYVHDRSGLHLLAHASGASRLFLVIGLIVGLIGFGMFAFGILDFMLQTFDAMESESLESPDFARMAFWMPLGFGIVVVGTVLWAIGAVLFRRSV